SHELAHLARRDDWTNLVQKLVKAILFFHPAVWWIESRLSLEREMACDAAVLAEQPDPRIYARCLLSLAEKSLGRRGVALAQAAVSRLNQLSDRVRQVLDTNRVSSTRIGKTAIAGATVLSAIGLVLISKTPQVVSFQAHRPASLAQRNRTANAWAMARPSHLAKVELAYHPSTQK